MATGSVRVEGLRELNRDLAKFSKDAQRGLQKELRAIAEPIAQDVRARVSRFGAVTAGGVTPGTRAGAAYVRQRAKKTSGLRPDFGALQMRRGFLPALEANEAGTIRLVDAMLDRLAADFNS
jgi:hypothetical protein